MPTPYPRYRHLNQCICAAFTSTRMGPGGLQLWLCLELGLTFSSSEVAPTIASPLVGQAQHSVAEILEG